MIFSLAKPDETDAVWQIYAAAVPDQNQKGIFHWDEEYPTRDIIENDIAERKCYVVRENGVPVAVLRIDGEQHPAYQTVDWKYGEPYICVHRLCVHPRAQGKGLAKHIMKDVLALYSFKGYAAVRLDTYRHNWIAMRLYEGLGFERRQTVHFEGRGDREYMCFEINLTGSDIC